MEQLGKKCILFSQFVEGAQKATFPKNKDIEYINDFYTWKKIKDNPSNSEEYYPCGKTQYYILFPKEVICLDILNEILNDLAGIYKRAFPFGTKQDFLDYVLDGTLSKLNAIVNADIIEFADSPSDKTTIYIQNLGIRGEVIEYILDSSMNIDYYKQYFRKVIKLIEEFDFEHSESIEALEIINEFDEENNNSIEALERTTKMGLENGKIPEESPFGNLKSDQDQLKEFTEYLKEVKKAFSNEEEYKLANSLVQDFLDEKPINIENPIFVRNGNIKKLAFVLGEIWRNKKNGVIPIEYLRFYKQVFSIFKNQEINEKSLFSCNLYKYSISKT
jgi:hypothetical protein